MVPSPRLQFSQSRSGSNLSTLPSVSDNSISSGYRYKHLKTELGIKQYISLRSAPFSSCPSPSAACGVNSARPAIGAV